MFNWKITDVQASDGVITQAKYHVTLSKDGETIETEGHWRFGDPVAKVAFDQVTEEMVIDWVKEEATQYGKNIIESRLTEQLEALQTPKVLPPWVPQVFSLDQK